MTRLAVILVAMAVIIAGAFWAGMRWDEGRDLRGAIEGTKDANEAVDEVSRTGAADWLRNTFGGPGRGNP